MDPNDARNLEEALDQADEWLEGADAIMDAWEREGITLDALAPAQAALFAAQASLHRAQAALRGLFTAVNAELAKGE